MTQISLPLDGSSSNTINPNKDLQTNSSDIKIKSLAPQKLRTAALVSQTGVVGTISAALIAKSLGVAAAVTSPLLFVSIALGVLSLIFLVVSIIITNRQQDSISYNDACNALGQLQKDPTPNANGGAQKDFWNALVHSISGYLYNSPGPNGYTEQGFLASIQKSISAHPQTNTDIYYNYNVQAGTDTNGLLANNNVQDMLTAMWAGFDSAPTFTIPTPTIADTTLTSIYTEQNSIPFQPGSPDSTFMTSVTNTFVNDTDSTTTASAIKTILQGVNIPAGVTQDVQTWFTNLLNSLGSSAEEQISTSDNELTEGVVAFG